MDVAVVGAGSWGTALALLLGEAGHSVTLWARSAAAAAALAAHRENRRYLPGRSLPATVTPTVDLAAAVAGRPLVLWAVPSEALRRVAGAASDALAGGVLHACASKGLESGSGRTLDAVLQDVLPGAAVVLLSGPTFAAEVAAGLPAALVAASTDSDAAASVQAVLATERFRVYTSDDVVGVAMGGALKNVIAIAVGCADGMGLGMNARAALITRGLAEISRLAVRLGANPLTLSGLAGLGDLVLTCTGDLSRNRRVGLGLGRGEAMAQVLAGLGQVAEGVGTAGTAQALALAHGVDMPIVTVVSDLLAGRLSATAAVGELMRREQKAERD